MPTALIVDDEPLMLQFVTKILERHGYSVVAAGSGAVALESYRARGEAIDILVTDIVMPEMDGIELARELLKDRPTLPVVFMSGYVSCPPLKEYDRRMFAFVRKPFSPEKLASTVRDVLSGGSPPA